MFLKKFWFFSVCGLLCIYNLYDTIQDSKLVRYVNNEKDIPKINFSLCIELEENLLGTFKRKSDNGYFFTVKQMLEHTCESFFDENLCNGSVFLDNSYLFNYHVCLSINITHLDSLIRKLNFKNFTIFAYFHGQSEIYYFLNILNDNGYRFPFNLHVVFHLLDLLEMPFETDCFNYSNKNINLKTREHLFSRASCLIECFKIKSRSLNYYYSTRDLDNLTIYSEELNKFKQTNWKIINLTDETEALCRNICKYKSCEVIFSLHKWSNNKDHKTYNLTYSILRYTAKPSYYTLYITFSFLSLISLFLNVSVYRTSLKLIRKTLMNGFRKSGKFFKKFYWLIKLITLIISFLCLSKS